MIIDGQRAQLQRFSMALYLLSEKRSQPAVFYGAGRTAFIINSF